MTTQEWLLAIPVLAVAPIIYCRLMWKLGLWPNPFMMIAQFFAPWWFLIWYFGQYKRPEAMRGFARRTRTP